MKRQRVRSSSIASVGYDADSRTLELRFVDGDVYQYFDVPPAVHAELMRASSIGAFVNTRIKPAYDYVEVT